jgi:hypothetical protein
MTDVNTFFGIDPEELEKMTHAQRSMFLQKIVQMKVPSLRFLRNATVLWSLLTLLNGGALYLAVTGGHAWPVVAFVALTSVYVVRKAGDVTYNAYHYGQIVARVETHGELSKLIAQAEEKKA